MSDGGRHAGNKRQIQKGAADAFRTTMKRVFLIVLDSVGAGELPDAADFGDSGAHTLRSVFRTGLLHIPHLLSLGLGNVRGLDFLGKTDTPQGAYGKAAERSRGKDTTTGHWEIAGLYSPTAMPTFPQGFPAELMEAYSRATGRPLLCNRPYSGTEVIRDFGRESIEKKALIVYTSADSVFQVAAHTDVVPLDELYRDCEIARKLLVGPLGVGRVIARPFDGEHPFHRTADRRDFSLPPHGETLLDALHDAGRDVLGVGKISDIFAARGLTRSFPVHGNPDCTKETERLLGEDFCGLCFVNLVDFDMVYGHRNDAEGYARALNEFDTALGRMLPRLQKEDVLFITADHGCDPGDVSTDHTREYVPILTAGPAIHPCDLGVRATYADIGATVAELLGCGYRGAGQSFAAQILG